MLQYEVFGLLVCGVIVGTSAFHLLLFPVLFPLCHKEMMQTEGDKDQPSLQSILLCDGRWFFPCMNIGAQPKVH